ncbi:hypothetical protein L1785_03195 [Antribacter sp. KLBMP9083]|uniref:Uncharacterized protein n=1 Tax=Antribacter soli TaxID=2910976 RepID=A0AA41QC97_9MICO|nr:hypothetical protein [Antribacter soli]MCF4119976.1 hypothetical protein [Antribacter soli]
MRTRVLALAATVVLTASACTAPDSGPRASGTASPSGTAAPSGSAAPSGTAGPGSSGSLPSGASGGQSGGEGSETAPSPVASDGPLSSLAVAPPAAGRRDAAPDAGTAAGLLAGFPTDVVTVPEHLVVSSSSVSAEGDRYQVTLDGTADGGCDLLLIAYRAWFTGGGFAETATDARPGSTEVTFVRDDGSVALAATDDGGACGLSLFATLTAR